MSQTAPERSALRFARRREAGVALITAMMILVLVVTLALSAMESTRLDQQVAGVQTRRRVALQAAEAGIATMLVTMGSGTPTLTEATFGDATVHHGTQPSYRLDPNVASPVESLGSTPMPGMSLNINGSGPKFQVELWRLNVEGVEPAGMTARLEVGSSALWGK